MKAMEALDALRTPGWHRARWSDSAAYSLDGCDVFVCENQRGDMLCFVGRGMTLNVPADQAQEAWDACSSWVHSNAQTNRIESHDLSAAPDSSDTQPAVG
jgi:hypothetical protein